MTQPPVEHSVSLATPPSADAVAARSDPSALDLPAALIAKCIASLTDILLVTEGEPLDEPGPRIVFVNGAFERMTGYTPAEVIGRSPRFLQGPLTDRHELDRIKAAVERGGPVRAELVNYKKNGDLFSVEMDIVPIFDAGGRCTHWVAIQRDVTARKHAEAEARAQETQHIEALGRLSFGIAHDFNNIVSAILGNAAIGLQAITSGQAPRTSLEQISTAALRARSLVQKILTYVRHQPQAFEPELLGPIVGEATDLLRPTLAGDVALTVSIAAEPLWALADASQLYQVLLNLCTNATYAMRGASGAIHIVLDAVDAAAVAHGPAASSGVRFGRIRVSDTGCGMDEAIRARMFEPYFTTKGIGHGTGLGLSVVSGIVTAHGGTISVESQVGRGSEFVLLFPLIDAAWAPAPQNAPEPAPAPETAGGGANVMVVDDDEVVMIMFERMLTRWGFSVSVVDDPHEAVALVRSNPERFDAIVADMNMPACSGLELAREVAQVRPDLPVLIGSGYVDDALTEAAAAAGVAAVFRKEFAVEQLGDLLHDVLARPGGRTAGRRARRADVVSASRRKRPVRRKATQAGSRAVRRGHRPAPRRTRASSVR